MDLTNTPVTVTAALTVGVSTHKEEPDRVAVLLKMEPVTQDGEVDATVAFVHPMEGWAAITKLIGQIVGAATEAYGRPEQPIQIAIGDDTKIEVGSFNPDKLN